jgi:hypothetical protein
MISALERAAEILGLGLSEVDASVVPPRRLAEASRYGMDGKISFDDEGRLHWAAPRPACQPSFPSLMACLRKTTPSIMSSWAGSSGK